MNQHPDKHFYKAIHIDFQVHFLLCTSDCVFVKKIPWQYFDIECMIVYSLFVLSC